MGQGQVPSTLYVCNNREFLTEKFKWGIPEKKQGGKRQVKPSLSLRFCQGILRLELFGYLRLGSQKALVIVWCRVFFRQFISGVKNWSVLGYKTEVKDNNRLNRMGIHRPAVKLSVLEVFDSILFPSEFSLNTFGTLYRTLPLYLSPSSCQLILNVAFRQLISTLASEHQKSIWR